MNPKRKQTSRNISVEIQFLSPEEVIAIHKNQIIEFGGEGGILSEGGLHSAIASPQNHYHYAGTEDIFKLAAVLIHHLIKDHVFNDANKRTAFQAGIVFLYKNGIKKKFKYNLKDLAYEVVNNSIDENELAVKLKE